MKLKQTKKGSRVLIEPIFNFDLPMFMHCSGGLSAITLEIYENTFLPVCKHHHVIPKFDEEHDDDEYEEQMI